MAEIPVERKTGGLPWWLIPLLLLLLLIPLLFFMMRGCSTAPVVGNTNGNSNANRAVVTGRNGNMSAATTTGNAANGNSTISIDNKGTATGNNVTDVNIFGSTADKLSLAGRGATLTNVKVNEVLSDHVFTVTAGSGEMFVYLDESQDTGGGAEKSVKIQKGQTLNLTGDFRKVPSGETEGDKTGNKDGTLTKAEYEKMKGQQVYLHARAQQK